MPTTSSPPKPSRAGSKRARFNRLAQKARPGLAVDTSFSRHRAPAPEQVFPYESRTQELSFVSFSDIKALKGKRNGSGESKFKEEALNEVDDLRRRQNTQQKAGQGSCEKGGPPQDSDGPVVHKRVHGLRPTPLDLTSDISPSDRAITIGISVPSAGLSRPEESKNSRPHNPHPLQREISQERGHETPTPTIVITPAKENFEMFASPEETSLQVHGGRPTSSVYSRYTTGAPKQGRLQQTPPVPPLPLFALEKRAAQESLNRDSTMTVFEEQSPPTIQHKGMPINTNLDRQLSTSHSGRDSKRLTSQSHLPTPRRSKGWWNVLSSPFSATSTSRGMFLSSPREADEDRAPMLSDQSGMGKSSSDDPHAGVIFTNRALDDDELRSAPPDGSNELGRDARQPKRADTAPGVLDSVKEENGINIYRIPSTGAAAEYYDLNVRYSGMRSIKGMRVDDDPDWSPSQSVYRKSRAAVAAGAVAGVGVGAAAGAAKAQGGEGDDTPFEEDFPVHENDNRRTTIIDSPSLPAAEDRSIEPTEGCTAPAAYDSPKDNGPFSDSNASDFHDFSGTHPAATSDRAIFTSPTATELRGGTPGFPPAPPVVQRQDTVRSHLSPSSATPVVEDAHVARFWGPHSSHGELRQVDVTPNRTPIPHDNGLRNATMSSRGPPAADTFSEKSLHSRSNSDGLGISHNASQTALFPPPKRVCSEKQQYLTTDRFGQLTVRSTEQREPTPPWYRRFLWWLLAAAAALLLLLIVLLVMFVPQRRDDMPVQAQWKNLTGFPALPTGIATVIAPEKVEDEGACVEPKGLWNCELPAGVKGGKGESTTPDFRLEIRFRGGKVDNDTALEPAGRKRDVPSPTARAGHLVKRGAWSDFVFASKPAPPSREDREEIGREVDGVSEPYEGEETPFSISLLNASALLTGDEEDERMVKRDEGFRYPYPSPDKGYSDSDSQPSSAFNDDNGDNEDETNDEDEDEDDENENIDDKDKEEDDANDNHGPIPAPLLTPSSHPLPPTLYPHVRAQPLRLYNRGQRNEHYAFHAYYPRTLYVGNLSASAFDTPEDSSKGRDASPNGTTPHLPASLDANVPLEDAGAVCTFAHTRVRVAIWTRRGRTGTLGGGGNATAGREGDRVEAVESSANEMEAPGSFPLPVSVVLDRAAGADGDGDERGVYCHGVDGEGVVREEVGLWVREVLGGEGKGKRDGEEDGGGTGCGCKWDNFGVEGGKK